MLKNTARTDNVYPTNYEESTNFRNQCNYLSIYLLGNLVLDGVALLPGHGDAELLQPVEALLLGHRGGDGLVHGDALGPGHRPALTPRHRDALLPAGREKVRNIGILHCSEPVL